MISFYILPEYMNYIAIKYWRLWAGASLLMIVISYGAAALSFQFIEKPFIERVQRVREKVFRAKRKIRPGKLLSAFLLCILALLFIFPLLWLLDASLRPPLEVIQSPPAIFQQPIWKSIESYTRDSYLAAFWHFDVGRALFNSIIVSSGTICLIFVTSPNLVVGLPPIENMEDILLAAPPVTESMASARSASLCRASLSPVGWSCCAPPRSST